MRHLLGLFLQPVRALSAALLVVGLLSTTTGCPRKVQVIPPCSKNADCSGGRVCVAGACIADACGGTCEADQVCLDGNCKTADGIDCHAQATLCPKDFTCTGNGTCARGCTEDGECPKAGFNVCDVDKFLCVQCAVDNDCTTGANAANQKDFCNRDTGFCVGCVDDRSCYVNGAPAGQFCDPVAHICQMGCNGLDDCPSGTKSCSPPPSAPSGVSQCIECLPSSASADCIVPGRIACDPARLQCVQCNVDNDCASLNTLPPYCEVHLHRCVICTDNSACPMGQVCDQESFSCVPGCAGGSGGPNCPPNTVCKPAASTKPDSCVACLQDADCPQGDICIMGSNGEPQCVVGCSTDDNCPANRVCDPSRGERGQCVGCLRDEQCAAQGLICDQVLEECRCKKEGESCAQDSECGYRLIPDGNGGMIADCHAQGARCLTKVRCGATGCSQERVVRNVCVVTGQGLADQCDPDTTGCPDGFVNELGQSVNNTSYSKLCVPSEDACTFPFCGNGCL